MEEYDCNIACITETKLTTHTPNIPGYSWETNNRQKKQGGGGGSNNHKRHHKKQNKQDSGPRRPGPGNNMG